ncbi:cytochrome P450 [Myriangium duriaei CBS 260.36]|uniref:Cytochrome P450 n=1 Tax=Myriangium duriaei CBS 260.36 TaxID=1168546 RepID=A0A9P4J9W8_9PEZI|nr:cytochrome P450 [Myriangium duriaei CBS 260.36]
MERYADEDKLFRMSHPVTRMTIDIIGKIVMDIDFNSQNQEHELVSAFESAVDWMPLGFQYRPSELWDFRRSYYDWRNGRIMDRYIDKQLVERWRTRKQRGRSKYVIDLAFETFLKDTAREGKEELDSEFRRDAINQVKIFLFAGHETSSSTLCFCFYYFSRLPEVRTKARQEIENVFGKNANIAEMMKKQPTLVNKLEYITAIIKEALRMHAPANAMRRGAEDFFIKDPTTGQMIATEGLDLLNLAIGNHYNKAAWGSDAFVFRPERWFEKTPEKAFVAFSKSPRNCIGQELAMIEMRITCAIVFANFDMRTCFDELDKLKGDGTAWPSDTEGIQELWGVDMYQASVTAKPREGMPVRISKYSA